MENTVVGLFESAERAHDAFGALIEKGFDRDHVSLLVNENAADYFRSAEGTSDKELDDATAGAERGAMIGGKLYLITFEAPRLHYFDAGVAAFRQVADSAKL